MINHPAVTFRFEDGGLLRSAAPGQEITTLHVQVIPRRGEHAVVLGERYLVVGVEHDLPRGTGNQRIFVIVRKEP